MLSCARAAVGATFTGYKGGKYLMTFSTECYVAEYGVYGGDDDALSLARFPWLSPDATEALTLRARVAELEAERDGYRNGQAQVQAMFDGLWKSNAALAASHNALRDALKKAERNFDVTAGQTTDALAREACVRYRDECSDALASTPSADLSAHDAEVGMRVVSECAMTMRSKCDCTHCDENAPGWEGRAIVERALAAQEVKP